MSFFLDAGEQAVVSRVLDFLRAEAPDQAAIAEESLDRLAATARLLDDAPSITSSWQGRRRSSEALIDLLCRVPDYDLDLHVPTRAVLGQAYVVVKINFLKALSYALESVEPTEDARNLDDEVQLELGQSIYSKLAEELFISIVTTRDASPEAKTNAAKALFLIWEDRLLIEIDDFAPALESMWSARNRVRPVLGAMLGTHEIFRLLHEASDARFVDYFHEDDVPEEQLQAFEEFLFGLSHEEITRLRAQPGGPVSAAEAERLLGNRSSSMTPQGGPQAFYSSYKKRRFNAQYRTMTQTSGPKKTAEEYVTTAFLRRGTVTWRAR